MIRLTLAREQERRRIAAGLHDAVGHSLALARVKLDLLLPAVQADQALDLSEIADLIDRAIQATRTLSFDLGTPILYELGLEPALRDVGERLVTRSGLCFTIDCDRRDKQVAHEIRVVLFRSTEELLHNVLKHAGARSVRVSLRRVASSIVITVADDGKGFDLRGIQKRRPAHRGLGLYNITQQLQSVGGSLHVTTSPGQGTICQLVAPTEWTLQ